MNGRFLAELRRSNAAGSHGKRSPDRYNTKRKVIEEETMEPWLIEREPTLEELADLESLGLLEDDDDLGGYSPFDDYDDYYPYGYADDADEYYGF